MASLICAGIATLDIVFRVGAIPSQPLKYKAESSAMASGGCALYAALAAARLGGRVALAAPVGNDAFAAVVRNDLQAEGVETGMLVTVPGAATPRSAVFVDPQGERMIVNHRDPALFAADLPKAASFAADAMLADTRWPRGAAQLFAMAVADCPKVLDAEPPFDGTEALFSVASHVAFSEQGLAAFAGTDDMVRAVRMAHERCGGWVCVTRGGQPVLCCDSDGVSEVPAGPITPIDTLGAGDVWHGAFALHLAEGLDEITAVRRANVAAALKASRQGGRAALASRAETDRYLKEECA